MLSKRDKATLALRDPFALLRQMTSEFDRMFAEPPWTMLRTFGREHGERPVWIPRIEMFEKQNRLVTRVELPGLKKEDVKVEVVDGALILSGERKRESEEQQEPFYRCELEYGSFYRSVPLPDNVKVDDVKATFLDGVLEVSVPLPARLEEKPRTVPIEDAKPVKTAA